MALKDFPDKGELIIGTVIKAKGFGAFIQLEEYPDKEGFLHIKEVASGWVKNIRNYVREKQRVVCQVLDIDPSKNHIDLSLKRVNDHQRREKIQQWKNEQKAKKLLEMTAERIGKKAPDLSKKVANELIKKYGSLYRAFEEVLTNPESLKEEGFKGDWVPAFIETAKENIAIPYVNVKGFVKLFSPGKNGIQTIIDALKNAEKKTEDIVVTIRYQSAPLYRIQVQAPEYKTAEKELKEAAEKTIGYIIKVGGEGEFNRENK